MAYYYNTNDRKKFEELIKKNDEELTKEEDEFLKDMILQEEIAYDCRFD